MSNYYSDKKYEGPEAILVTMDIGTTQSAVSFAHFITGVHTQVHTVTQWPGLTNGTAKTPSMVSYRNRIVKACGAEAMRDFEEHPANVAHWFKLHLHPALIAQYGSAGSEIPPLPAGITVERVYTDMMRYLMERTRQFFETTTPNGAEIWERLHDNIILVLATPNGWDIREQATLRKAAIKASLVTEERAGQLLQFVTEAEASVHYVLANKPGKWLRKKTVFAVVDCGGSTVDTTVYRCVLTSPLSLTETCPSECIQAGGIFVNREARKMIAHKLRGSRFDDEENIKSITGAFELDIKTKYDGTMDTYDAKFGGTTDNDARLGIHKGRITFSDQDVKPVFDAVINKIVTSCSNIIIRQRPEYVLIVGGFGESPYLQKVLSQKLDNIQVQIVPTGDSVKKAAAEGAAIAHIKKFVVARAAKATFGGCVRPVYDKKLHSERKHAIQLYADGTERVDGAFHMWIAKGTVLQGTFAHKLSYHLAWDAASTSRNELVRGLGTVSVEVFAWEGTGIPVWCKDEQGRVLSGMRLICILNADLSALAKGLQITTGSRKQRFYRVDYNVCIYFGGTQLHAKLQWKEGRALRESEVKVMPYVS